MNYGILLGVYMHLVEATFCLQRKSVIRGQVSKHTFVRSIFLVDEFCVGIDEVVVGDVRLLREYILFPGNVFFVNVVHEVRKRLQTTCYKQRHVFLCSGSGIEHRLSGNENKSVHQTVIAAHRINKGWGCMKIQHDIDVRAKPRSPVDRVLVSPRPCHILQRNVRSPSPFDCFTFTLVRKRWPSSPQIIP